MRLSHTLLTGATVDFDAPYDLGERSTNFVSVIMENDVRQFGSGPRSFAEDAARETLEILKFDEEYDFQGGTLRLGEAPLVDPVTGYSAQRQAAIWEGAKFSLKVSRFETTYLALIALLDRFTFQEEPSGLVLHPRDTNSTKVSQKFHPPSLLKEIANLGLLEVKQLTEDTKRRVPRWQGKRVRGGELFADGLGTPSVNFYLVGESALVRIRPLPARGIDESRTLDFVEDLLVEWE